MEGAHRIVGLAACVLVLGGCTMIGSPELAEPPAPRPGRTPAAAPRPEPPSSRGNMVQYEQFGATYRVLETSRGYEQEGIASWYGEAFHGRPTSSGERYDMNRLSAAHRTLPLPSWVEVTNVANGRSVVLRVNDRGPFHDTHSRIIDVSYAAAVELGIDRTGTAWVRVRAIPPYQVRTTDGSR